MYASNEKRGTFRTFIMMLLTSAGVCALAFLLFSRYFSGGSAVQQAPSAPQEQSGNVNPSPQQMAVGITGTVQPGCTAVAKAAVPGVVGISVLKVDRGSLFNKNAVEQWGVGSGAIVTKNGYILTNNHVAGGKNQRIIVSFHDGRSADGTTVWADPVLDLAIVKVEMDNLPTLPLGDANTLQVGEPAIAIGNPLGLEFQRTVTSGIVSALNRTIKIDTDQGSNFMEDLIQTDASINPGNSGGPLLNSRGQVVGINTIKVTSAEGMGFAIPINIALPIIQKLSSRGSFVEPYMGVFAYDKQVLPYLDKNINIENGVYIANVDGKGPAYKAGITVGCIIVAVDGDPVNTMLQLRTLIYNKNPGDTINITHITGGKTMNAAVRLMAKEQDGLLTR